MIGCVGSPSTLTARPLAGSTVTRIEQASGQSCGHVTCVVRRVGCCLTASLSSFAIPIVCAPALRQAEQQIAAILPRPAVSLPV